MTPCCVPDFVTRRHAETDSATRLQATGTGENDGGMPSTNCSRIVLVGAGPRSVMLLERLSAHARHRQTPLSITVVDPFPPGPGRIWRDGQSPHLSLNSTAADVSIFNDDSCTLGAPSHGGPPLDEWVQGVREASIETPWAPDAETLHEIQRLRASDFPSRRLNSLYLTWALNKILAESPSNVDVTFVTDTVERVDPDGAGHRVHTASGRIIEADVVTYLLGHTDAAAPAETGETDAGDVATDSDGLAAAARAAGLTYHGPAYTADDEHADLAPGQDVLVRGLGLAAVDLILMLTLGRGGRFEPYEEDEDLPFDRQRLTYKPSGNEPHLLLGSRRGVPYRSKSLQSLAHAPRPLEVLTSSLLTRAAEEGRVLDLEEDLFPLIRTELSLAHHRELFEAHPDRTLGDWEAVREVILSLEESSEELDTYLSQLVPDPADRFSVAAWDRPLTDLAVATRADLDQVLTEHLRKDLDVHLDPERTSTLAVFHALLKIHVVLADAPDGVLSHRTLTHAMPRVWQGFFSYLASGPPPQRLHQILALVDAGVIGFLGPDIQVDVVGSGAEARFRAQSPAVAQETFADALVDAWLPANDVTRTANPALAHLASIAGISGGRIAVNGSGAVLDPAGERLPGVWALGAPTSSPDAGAFARPHTNALPFRTTDVTAQDIVEHLTSLPVLVSSKEQS
jgi:hypothetical protein